MSDIVLASLGALLKAMRLQREWTLADVCDKTDISVSYLSDIERGRTMPSVEVATKLAETYGTSLSALFGGAEEELSADEYQLLYAWRSGKWAELLAMVSAKISEVHDERTDD